MEDARVETKSNRLSISLGKNAPSTVQLKYAISYVSHDQAKQNFDAELASVEFDALARKGKKAWSDKHMARVRRDPNLLRTNEIWCADHRIADVMVLWPDGHIGRPWITAYVDLRSARWTGWVVRQQPNSDGVAAAGFARAFGTEPAGASASRWSVPTRPRSSRSSQPWSWIKW